MTEHQTPNTERRTAYTVFGDESLA